MTDKKAPEGVSYFAFESALFHMEKILRRWQIMSAVSLVAVALLLAKKR